MTVATLDGGTPSTGGVGTSSSAAALVTVTLETGIGNAGFTQVGDDGGAVVMGGDSVGWAEEGEAEERRYVVQ